jgi:hypothetical protein
VPNYEEMGYIGYKNSIKKIKEIKRLRKNIKIIDILHCVLVTINIICALYIVSLNLINFLGYVVKQTNRKISFYSYFNNECFAID